MLSNSAAAPVERVHPLIALDIPRESDVVHNQVESTARQLTLHDIYEIVITWPPALLDPPRCNATNEFVDIMADLYYQASEEVHFQSCSALEAATVLSRCVLQRIESRKTAIIRKAMERRLDLWRNNDFNALFDEARCLQARADLNKYDAKSALLLHETMTVDQSKFAGVDIRHDGVKILGSFIGSSAFMKESTRERIEDDVYLTDRLT
ncbi:hypothetical protein GJ496_007249 [Pomphorhynchus laevis]|nr:hypothetical protein GJ496_007249 [Pomphorhynchus laevis]